MISSTIDNRLEGLESWRIINGLIIVNKAPVETIGVDIGIGIDFENRPFSIPKAV